MLLNLLLNPSQQKKKSHDQKYDRPLNTDYKLNVIKEQIKQSIDKIFSSHIPNPSIDKESPDKKVESSIVDQILSNKEDDQINNDQT